MRNKVYQEFASYFIAMKLCEANENYDWADKHDAKIGDLMGDAPSGSGFDNGTFFDDLESRDDKLVFCTSFHHMDEHGHYDGWTDHTVIVTPTFDGFNVKITGRNRNDIKEYIGEEFHHWLTRECESANQI